MSDGVVELVPLPRRTAAKEAGKEGPMGLVRIWKLPVLGEKGGGVGAMSEGDLAFVVTRKRFEIMAYSLPPADDDEAAQEGERRGGEGGGKKATKVDLEF